MLRISRWRFCCQFHFTSYYDFELLDWWCALVLESNITITKWLFAPMCDICCFPDFRVLLPFPHLIWSERAPAWSGPQILERKAQLSFQTELSSYCSIIKFYSLWMGHHPVSFKSLQRSNHRRRSRIYRVGTMRLPDLIYRPANRWPSLNDWLTIYCLNIQLEEAGWVGILSALDWDILASHSISAERHDHQQNHYRRIFCWVKTILDHERHQAIQLPKLATQDLYLALLQHVTSFQILWIISLFFHSSNIHVVRVYSIQGIELYTRYSREYDWFSSIEKLDQSKVGI